MADLFDAVEKLGRQSTLYELLGCDELSTKEQINAEFKQRAKKLHPDKRPGDNEALEHFKRLCQARDTLCDDQKRKEYDYWLRSGVRMPFEMCSQFKRSLHSSVHWAPHPQKKPMLDCMSDQKRICEKQENLEAQVSYFTDKNSQQSRLGWMSRTNSQNTRKFRKYEI